MKSREPPPFYSARNPEVSRSNPLATDESPEARFGSAWINPPRLPPFHESRRPIVDKPCSRSILVLLADEPEQSSAREPRARRACPRGVQARDGRGRGCISGLNLEGQGCVPNRAG